MNPPKKWQEVGPSPAAVAAATRLGPEVTRDVYAFAAELDRIAEEARENERRRIYHLGFLELCAEFWKGRKLYARNKYF